MFQVIHPPYKKVTLACIACLCFEIGVCPWPDLSALFQYTSLTPVVSLHLIPRIKYHPGIPVTNSFFRVNTLLSFCKNVDITYNVSSNPPTLQKITLACIACLCFETGVCPWPDLSSLFQYTSPTRVVSLHLIPRIQYHPGILVTLLTGSSFPFEQTEVGN